MLHSPHTSIKVDEETPLNMVPGSAEPQQGLATTAACCGDKHHRRLTICSIICGISCIGIKALIDSVKAEVEPDREASARFSRRAKRLAIISIVTWLAILALTPMLMALFSYVVTLRD
ncbi:transmembrane protein 265-like isoform X2 [Syngnathoides biaculeatus]|nr:transmembrane protein 265-like isoform X2 [Syngnathoides biaculeatus]XP_061702852.1 transmembrane protein 265-like isoform X2 [Syngnathoides biaculeatus]